MPEPPRMVPFYLARVLDLRIEESVSAACEACGHISVLPVSKIWERAKPNEFVKHIGLKLRCTVCGRLGADIDARRALWPLRLGR